MPRLCPPESRGINVTRRVSDSDPSVPLISTFQNIWFYREPDDNPHTGLLRVNSSGIPRPRVLMQMYYTGPKASDPDRLERVARALEETVLGDRNANRGQYEADRLDVYGLPGADRERCIAQQRAEIASREFHGTKEWYIQRYDLGGSCWRRALVMVRKVDVDNPDKHVVGLSTVYFDKAREDGDHPGSYPVWEYRADNLNNQWVIVHELKHELNWQHTLGQFDYPDTV